MTQAQKVIKYFAYALAIFIIISIFSLVIEVVKEVCGIYVDNDVKFDNVEYDNYLELDLSRVEVYIKTGDLLKAESDNKNINIKQDGNKLIVKEKSGLLLTKNKAVLNVTVPENFEFDYVKIDTGAGSVNIDKLITNLLDVDMGAGNLKINSLLVSSKAIIDGGVGDIYLNDVHVNKFDLDLGTGNSVITGNIYSGADIDTGVGNVSLNLKDNVENFTFDISKGIGKVTLNNDEIKKDSTIGNGKIDIEIDGGVGNIEINTRY